MDQLHSGARDRPKGQEPWSPRSLLRFTVLGLVVLLVASVAAVWLIGDGRGDPVGSVGTGTGGPPTVTGPEPTLVGSLLDGAQPIESAVERRPVEPSRQGTDRSLDRGCGSVGDGSEVEEIRIAPNAVSGSVQGSLRRGATDRHRFEAVVGQRVSAGLVTDGAATLGLIDPNGQPLALDAAAVDLVLSHSGPYRLCVTASPATNAPVTEAEVDYRLTLTITDPTAPSELTWNRTEEIEELADGGSGRRITTRGLEFSGAPPGAVADLNRAVAELLAGERGRWLSELDATVEQAPGDTLDRPQVLELATELTLVGDGLVSVRVGLYSEWTVSAYPIWWYRGLIYDLDRETVVTVDDLLIDSADRLRVDELVLGEVSRDHGEDPALLLPGGLDNAAFTLSPFGLEVVTGRGELLAPVFPGTETLLDWDELAGLINPDIEARAIGGYGESTVTPGPD